MLFWKKGGGGDSQPELQACEGELAGGDKVDARGGSHRAVGVWDAGAFDVFEGATARGGVKWVVGV